MEADADELFALDESGWRAHAAARGWQAKRFAAARGLAKPRQQRARADGVSLGHARAQGEDPRAWATERGWDDDRIRAAVRFLSPQEPPGGES